MIALALLLAAPTCPRTVAGSFCHGQWKGECFRDGTLRGMEDEICRARWSGNIHVSFERDADKIAILIEPRKETDAACFKKVNISSASLSHANRVEKIARSIRVSAKQMRRMCAVPQHISYINLRDLRATLRETDGLIHIFE